MKLTVEELFEIKYKVHFDSFREGWEEARKHEKEKPKTFTPKFDNYELWNRLTDALSGLPLTEGQVDDLTAVYREHFGININKESQ